MDASFFSQSDITALGRCFLFSGIGERYIRRVITDPLCDAVSYAKGETIYSETDFRKSLGIVIGGTAEVSRSVGEGRRYIMNVIGESGIFGAAALFGGDDAYVTEITAASVCRVVFIPQELMEIMLSEEPKTAMNYIKFLSGRVNFLNNKIKGLSSATASESVLRYIAENMRKSGEFFAVENIRSYSSLAQMLNIGRASLYRSLDELESRGVIRRDGKHIIVLDADGLMI